MTGPTTGIECQVADLQRSPQRIDASPFACAGIVLAGVEQLPARKETA
jgi:hypothetical protein